MSKVYFTDLRTHASYNLLYKLEMLVKHAGMEKIDFKDKTSFHISFIMSVSPECDCWAYNDAAIVPSLGTRQYELIRL